MKKAHKLALKSLLASFVILSALGCGDDPAPCTLESRAGLNVNVFDENTNKALCDVSVRATDGDYTESLSLQFSNDCRYSGAWDRPGAYRVDVSKEGYVDKSTEVVVPLEDVECKKVEGQLVEIRIRREYAGAEPFPDGT